MTRYFSKVHVQRLYRFVPSPTQGVLKGSLSARNNINHIIIVLLINKNY